jgi:hypothetical protein
VVKTQQCIQKLHTNLEKYVGTGSLPSICKTDADDDPMLHKPADWDIEQWLTFRTQAISDFFIEFKNPKRGFYLGNSQRQLAPTPSKEYMHNPLLGSILGVISRRKEVVDEFTLQQQEEEEDYQNILKNKNKNLYLKGKMDDCFFKNDAAQLAALDSRKDKKTEHLIHSLSPLIQFLHTDKVVLVVSKPHGWVNPVPKAPSSPSKSEQMAASPLMAKYPLLAQIVLSNSKLQNNLNVTPDAKSSAVEGREERGVIDDSKDKLVAQHELSDDDLIDSGEGCFMFCLLKCVLLPHSRYFLSFVQFKMVYSIFHPSLPLTP